MSSKVNRRKFVTNSMLASAGAAMAAGSLGSAAAPGAETPTGRPPSLGPQGELPRGKIGDLEISRLLLGGNLLTHYTHSRDLRYVYSLAKHYNTEKKILETLAVAEEHGINTLVIHNVPSSMKILAEHRRRGGNRGWPPGDRGDFRWQPGSCRSEAG